MVVGVATVNSKISTNGNLGLIHNEKVILRHTRDV